MKKISLFWRLVTLAILLASLMGCAAMEAPEVKPPEATPIPDCSVVVPDFSAGVGMITLLGKLGINDFPNQDPIILVNGAEETKRYQPQPGDVIVLAEKPEVCNGEYVAARQVSFGLSYGTWRAISGFQSSITDVRLLNALQQVCEGVLWDQFQLRFDGDIAKDGCNFRTGVIMSFIDGSESCEMYATVNEAYESTRTNLENVMWIETASTNTGENLCNR